MKITKRISQFFAKNWGKPTKYEKKVVFPDPLFKEKLNISKKKKKHKKPYASRYNTCPFCYTELKLVDAKDPLLFRARETWCRNCGASYVPECPACKCSTWLSKEGIYKHPWGGCGFEGKRKERKNG